VRLSSSVAADPLSQKVKVSQSSNSHQQKTGMKFIRALSKRWKWFYVAAWLLFGLSITGYGAVPTKPPEHEAAFNLPFFMLDAAGWAIVLSFILLVLSSLLFALDSRRLLSAIGSFPLTALVGIAILALIGPVTTLERLNVVHTNNHVYQLAQYRKWIDFRDEAIYLLYECDSWAITCRELYRHPAPSSYSEAFRSVSSPPPSYRLELGQNDIVLYINEQPVFTYDTFQVSNQ
jgi:hypothetical protein